MKKHLIRLSALLGLAVFIYILYRIGFTEIWQNLRSIGVWGFLILFGLRVLYWMLRTLNWKLVLDVYDDDISLLNVFKARMAGHSVSQLTPTAQIGSEVTRTLILDSKDKKASVASVIIDKTVEFLSVLILTLIGVIIVFIKVELDLNLKILFITVPLAALLVMFFFIVSQKKGLLLLLAKLFIKVKIAPRFFKKHMGKLAETDHYIFEFYSNHKWQFLKVLLLYCLLILLWAVEIHVGLTLLGASDISILDSFLITVLGNIALIFPFIPGSLGIYEATYIGLFSLFGLSAGFALSLVLIRRVIALVLALFGLVGLVKGRKSG